MPRNVSLAGINGDRADIIRWCLRNSSSAAGENAHEIADYMWKFHRDLLDTHGRVEKVQAVLRTMEANGEVARERGEGGRHYWRLTEGT